MRKSRKAVLGLWAAFGGLTLLPTVMGQGGSPGTGASVCLPFYVIIALTVTPVEVMIDTFRETLPGDHGGGQR
jgi:hypothetical protein